MRILILNGSPKKDGNTAIALHEMEKVFAEEGIETEIVQVGSNRSGLYCLWTVF